MLNTSPWSRFVLTLSVVIGTDCIGSYKSNYHAITATTVSSNLIDTILTIKIPSTIWTHQTCLTICFDPEYISKISKLLLLDTFSILPSTWKKRLRLYLLDSKRPSWPWSHGNWIYNYLCNQCLSPLIVVEGSIENVSNNKSLLIIDIYSGSKHIVKHVWWVQIVKGFWYVFKFVF
jgi:hypothetical protein